MEYEKKPRAVEDILGVMWTQALTHTGVVPSDEKIRESAEG